MVGDSDAFIKYKTVIFHALAIHSLPVVWTKYKSENCTNGLDHCCPPHKYHKGSKLKKPEGQQKISKLHHKEKEKIKSFFLNLINNEF